MANSILILKQIPTAAYCEQQKMPKGMFGAQNERGRYYAEYDFNETFRNSTFGSCQDNWKKFQNIILCSEFFSTFLHVPTVSKNVESPFKHSEMLSPMIKLHANEGDEVTDLISFGQELRSSHASYNEEPDNTVLMKNKC